MAYLNWKQLGQLKLLYHNLFFQLINVLSELFLFILVIVYVYMVIGLELFAVASNEPEDNYFEQYGCGLVSFGNEKLYSN